MEVTTFNEFSNTEFEAVVKKLFELFSRRVLM